MKGYDLLKQIARKLIYSAPLRLASRIVLSAYELVERLFSVLRTGALFGGPNYPFCHWTVGVKYPENITCGKGVVIGPKCSLGAHGGIRFGDNVRLSEGVMVETAGLDFSGSPPYAHVSRLIVLEEGVWVGARAIILAGVTVGRQAVIGAGVVVSRDVAEGAIIVGQAPRIKLPTSKVP
jgi:acetyltransferase-like isoleucine patch superfamily enzyme